MPYEPRRPHSGTGAFSVKSAYSFITGQQDEEGLYGWIWRIKCTERVKLFIWKIINNGLLANAEKKKRGLTDQGDCPRCGDGDETLDHMFRRCTVVEDCWRLTNAPQDFNASSNIPLVIWIEANCSFDSKNLESNRWHTTFPHLMWNIWKARNVFVFNANLITAGEIARWASFEAMEAQKILLKHQGPMMAKQVWFSWSPPPQGFLKLNTDGSRTSYTGMASASGVFRNHNGSWVTGFYTKIGTTNSFAAELWGLQEGLKIATNRGFMKLLAETVSLSMVQALDKEAPSRPETDVLIMDCLSLIRQLHDFKLTHTFREGNHCLDRLANMGHNGRWGTTLLALPPDEIKGILDHDAKTVAARRIF